MIKWNNVGGIHGRALKSAPRHLCPTYAFKRSQNPLPSALSGRGLRLPSGRDLLFLPLPVVLQAQPGAAPGTQPTGVGNVFAGNHRKGKILLLALPRCLAGDLSLWKLSSFPLGCLLAGARIVDAIAAQIRSSFLFPVAGMPQ